MSKEVDERVVQMEFDNRQFEKNVQTSMTTLEKLKHALRLDGASKGLEEVNSASKKIDFTKIENTACQAGFHIQDVWLKLATVLEYRVARQIADIVESTAKAFTIEPLKTGWDEYQLKMGSVQTIMASTGESLETVNQYLDELNKYSDDTIYSFSDMTQNIGKFTNAGVKLEDAVAAIKGVSNEAARSGANAQEASRAMYNFAQALSAGYVKLIDWKSIENANMATVEFKNELLKTALELGTVVKQEDKYISTTTNANGAVSDAFDATHMFNDSLAHQWMTTEVLTKTLGRYADKTTEIGEAATRAATEVKTFGMMMDALKESVQSGWAQTWEIIFGDFEQGKKLWTDISTEVSKFLDMTANARNSVLKMALQTSGPWEKFTGLLKDSTVGTAKFKEALRDALKANGKNLDELLEKGKSIQDLIREGEIKKDEIVAAIKKVTGVIGQITHGTDKAAESIENVTDKIEYFNDITRRVIRGEFGAGAERIEAMTEAGHKYADVQSLVNYIWERNGETWDDVSLSGEEIVKVIGNLSAEEKANLDLTEDEIKAFEELAKYAEETGKPIEDLIESLSKPSGRELVIDSLANAYKGLVKVFESIRDAWVEIFPPKSAEEKAEGLYGLIETINGFSKKLIMTEETADRLKRTFEGLFAVLDMIRWLISWPFKIAFAIIKNVLDLFNTDFLEVTALLGDMIVSFRNWIKENNYLGQGIKWLAQNIKDLIVYLYDWAKSSEWIKNTYENIADFLDKSTKNIRDWYAGLKDAEDIPAYIIKGLVTGLKFGISSVANVIRVLAQTIIDTICTILDINSPSKVMENIGGYVIQGLVNGIQNGKQDTYKAIKSIGNSVLDILKSINWVGIIDLGLKVISFNIWKKVAGVTIDAIGSIAKSFSNLSYSIQNVANAISKNIKAEALKKKSEALRTFAVAIAILTASLVVLAFIPTEKLQSGILVLTILVGLLLMASVALGKLGDSLSVFNASLSKGINFKSASSKLIQLGVALIALALVVKIISGIKIGDAIKGMAGLTYLMFLLIGFLASYSVLVKGKAAQNIDKAGKMIKKMATSLLLLIVVMKLAGTLSVEEMVKGTLFMGEFLGFVALLMLVTKGSGKNFDKIGKSISKIAGSMLLLVFVMKIAGSLSIKEMLKGYSFVVMFTSFVKLLAASINSISGEVPKIAKTLIGLSVSILILAGVTRILGDMSVGDLLKGKIAVTAFVKMITVFVKELGGIEHELPKMMTILIGFSVAIGVLGLITFLLGFVSIPQLAKGVAVVGVLSLFVTGLVKALRGVNNEKLTGPLIMLVTAITILSIALYALSTIESSKLIATAASLALVMSAFALMVQSIKAIDKGVITNVFGMLAIVAALSLLVIGLSRINTSNAIYTAIAVSTLLIAISLSIKMLADIREDVKVSLKTLGSVVLVVGILALILGVMDKLDVEASIKTATALSILMLTLTSVVVALSLVGPLATTATAAINALIEVALVMGALLLVMAGLNALIPDLEDFLKSGMPILNAIAEAIGSFVGNLIGGFLGGLSSGLPEMGTNLTKFMNNIQGFIDGIKDINPESAKGAAALAETILILTASELVSKLTSLFGASDFSSIAKKLESFGHAVVAYAKVIQGSGIDTETLESAANAGKMMAEMADSIPKTGGIIKFLTGETDLEAFGKQLVSFGRSIVKFSDVVDGNVNNDAVEAAANAGKMMTEMQSTIPGTRGVLQFFTGENRLDEFGFQLVVFGNAIVKFSDTVSGKISPSAIEAAANAGKMMAEMQSTIPNTGGLVSFFTGDRQLETFGTQLVVFGYCMNKFSDQLTQGKGIDVKAVEAAANAGKMMAEMAQTVPKSGGLFEYFDGRTDLAIFGDQLGEFGTGISKFSDAVTGHINPEAVKMAKNAGEIMVELQKALPENNSWWEDVFGGGKQSLSDFGNQLKDFGEGIAKYGKAIQNVQADKIGQVNGVITSTIGIVQNMSEVDSKGLKSFNDAMCSLSNDFSPKLIMFGKSLVDFNGTIKSGINKQKIDEAIDAGKKVVELAEGIKKVSEVNLTGIKKDDLSTFGTKMVAFGASLMMFSKEVTTDNINSESIEAAVNSGKLMVELSKAVNDGSDLFAILAGKDLKMEQFKTRMSEFASAITSFSSSITGLGGTPLVDKNSIEAATSSGQLLVALSKSLNEGGIDAIQAITGKDVKMMAFKTRMEDFATALSGFSSKVTGLGGTALVDKDAIQAAYDSGSLILALSDTLDKNSSFINAVAGNAYNFGTFGTHINEFAETIIGFSTVLSKEENKIDTGKIDNTIKCGEGMIKLAKSLDDNDIGVITAIAGAQNLKLDTFKTRMAEFGDAIVEFSKTISGEDGKLNYNESDINNAIGLGDGMVKLAKSFKDSGISGIFTNDTTSMGNLKVNMMAFGDAVNAYYSKINGVSKEGLSDAVDKTKDLMGLFKDSNNLSASGITAFSTGINELGQTSISKFIQAFKDSGDNVKQAISDMLDGGLEEARTKLEPLKAIGESFVDKIEEGSKSKKNSIIESIGGLIDDSVSAAKNRKEDFENVGKYLVEGFVKGINDNVYKAKDATKEMSKQAYLSAKDALDINSPSKEFEKLAEFVPAGFANGIYNMMGLVTNSSDDMAQTAIDTAKDALIKVNTAMGEDLNMSPTLRPVLDMDAMSTDRLQFMSDLTLSFDKPVNTMSQIVNDARLDIQRSNNEVIGAIRGLRDDITNLMNSQDSEIGFYVDGNKLGGVLVNPLNRQLNILSRREGGI